MKKTTRTVLLAAVVLVKVIALTGCAELFMGNLYREAGLDIPELSANLSVDLSDDTAVATEAEKIIAATDPADPNNDPEGLFDGLSDDDKDKVVAILDDYSGTKLSAAGVGDPASFDYSASPSPTATQIEAIEDYRNAQAALAAEALSDSAGTTEKVGTLAGTLEEAMTADPAPPQEEVIASVAEDLFSGMSETAIADEITKLMEAAQYLDNVGHTLDATTSGTAESDGGTLSDATTAVAEQYEIAATVSGMLSYAVDLVQTDQGGTTDDAIVSIAAYAADPTGAANPFSAVTVPGGDIFADMETRYGGVMTLAASGSLMSSFLQ